MRAPNPARIGDTFSQPHLRVEATVLGEIERVIRPPSRRAAVALGWSVAVEQLSFRQVDRQVGVAAIDPRRSLDRGDRAEGNAGPAPTLVLNRGDVVLPA